MSLNLPAPLMRKIEAIAKEEGRSKASIIEETLRFVGVKPGQLMRAPESLGSDPVRLNKAPLLGLDNSTVPGRITINLSGEIAEKVNRLAADQHMSKNRLVLSMLESSFSAQRTANVESVNRREDVLRYSRIMVDALQEALDYDPIRQHNQAPPALHLDDPAYLQELKNLVFELRTLNGLLETPKASAEEANQAVSRLSNHFHTFADSYAKTLGKGVAGLTIGAMAALLYKAGVADEVINAIWAHLKSGK